MTTRTITGTFEHVDGTPWVGGVVRFESLQTVTIGDVIYPKETHIETTDSNGEISVDLTVPDTGTAGYFISTPTNLRELVFIAAGLDVDLSSLLTASGSNESPSDLQTLIDAHVAGYHGDPQHLDSLVINDDGDPAHDFRAESDTEENMLLVDASADAIYFGGATNGVKIAKGGEITLQGTATRFDDLRIEPVARTTGTNAPTFEKWYDDLAGTSRGVYLYSFDDAAANAEKEIFFTMQMPHTWKEGSTIHLHVHWVGAVNDTTADPRWAVEYIWKDIGQVFGDSVIIYSDGTHVDGSGSPDASVTANKHYITHLADIVPDATQNNLSSILIGRLFRNSSDAGDTYNAGGAKCGLLYIDAHIEIDSFGSESEYIK